MFLGKRAIDGGFVLELFLITAGIVLGLRIPYLNLMVLVLCAWMIMFDRSLDHILDLIFFLIPFSTIFKVGMNGFALFNIITIIVLVRLLMANDWTFIFPDSSVFGMIVYILAGIRNAGIPDCIRFVSQTLIGSLVLANDEFRQSLTVKRKNTMMSLGIIASSLVAVMRKYFPSLSALYEQGSARIKLGSLNYYYRFMGVESNPNMYTVLISIAISVYLVYLVRERIDKLDMVLIGLLLVFGAMTVSMSFVLSLIMIVAIAAPILAKRNPRLMLCTAFVGIVGAVIILGVFGDSEAVQTILFRFQASSSDSADMSSITTGRSDIWMMYLDYFLSHPLVVIFGKGLGAKLPFRAAHNYYIETVYYLGIIGSMLYIMCHARIYAPSLYTHKKCDFYEHIPLIMLLIRGMARCLICNERMLCIFLIYTLTAIDTSNPTQPFIHGRYSS